MLTGSDSEGGKVFSVSGALTGPAWGSDEVGEETQFKGWGSASAIADLEAGGTVSVFLLGTLSV